MLSTAWYRFATSWRRVVGGYVALILVVGLGGGLALGSVAAARRTASSFSTFLASTNPSDLTIEPAGGGSPIGPTLDRHLVGAIGKFPHVRHVESYVALGASYRLPGGHIAHYSSVFLVGSLDGMLSDQDRFTVTEGRRANPQNPHQVEVTETAAQALGLHVGERFGVYVNGTGGATGRPFPVTVVGIGLLNREVVQDQIARFPTYVVATPALTRSLIKTSAFAYFGVQLDATPGAVAAVERDWNATQQYFTNFQVSAHRTTT